MTYIQTLPTPTRSFSFFGELQKDLRARRVGGFGRLWESSLKKLKSVTAAVMSTNCLFVFPVPAPCVDLLSLPLSIRLQHLTPVSRLHFFSRLRCRDYFLFLPPGVSSAVAATPEQRVILPPWWMETVDCCLEIKNKQMKPSLCLAVPAQSASAAAANDILHANSIENIPTDTPREAEDTIMTAVITIYPQDGTLGLGPLWVDLNGNKISLWDGTRGGDERDGEHPEENGGGFGRELRRGGSVWTSSGWRTRSEEERLNNPVPRSHNAINVMPGGEPLPFCCKTKPGWMRASDSRRTAALRAKLLWGRHLGQRGREASTEGWRKDSFFFFFLSLAFC